MAGASFPLQPWSIECSAVFDMRRRARASATAKRGSVAADQCKAERVLNDGSARSTARPVAAIFV